MKLFEEDRKLIEALINKNYLDRSFEGTLTQFIEKWEVRAFEAVLETRIIDQKKLADLISESFGIERFEHLSDYSPQNKRLNLPLPFLKEWNCYCLEKDEELYLVVANPTDESFLEALKKFDLKKMKIGVAEKSVVKRALHENYLLSEI